MTTTSTGASTVEGWTDVGRTVLITGTSSGIGHATALAAARAGWNVVATMRDTDRATAVRADAERSGVSIDVQSLDVTDADSVADCVADARRRHGRLDAVVNNAGSAHVGTLENDALDAIRACFEVNFFGVVAVTRAALPHLRESGGRVITVSSVGGVVGQPFNEAYCAAKFAVEGFMEALAPVAATVGVGVALVEPGAVASEFVTNAGLDPERMTAEAGPYADALGSYLRRVTGQFSTAAQPSTEVAALLVDLLGATDLPLRSQTSEAATQFTGAKLRDLDGSAVQSLTSAWVTAY